ncbi:MULTISPECIES: hypothetical protein [unclassified Sphingopyxis]|jgi:hypothetical protein|uniref:hypothetical protein n=1 Tax=unclassified Sphingopyxis TaxID=2614943 RepID=UPI00285C5CE4|nr:MULTISPECIES: hypothetical protein [unclassified Sphingopyxis]MDR6833575.1 hypothetical protein [Sphingopyxis sp. BE122]MDR7225844.1 hypothetical protein [Sphingopyxis sp. BE259]
MKNATAIGLKALIAVTATAAASSALAASPLNFTIDDVAITGRGPDGYCLPTGQAKQAADLLAKGDLENETPAMLIRCEHRDSAKDLKYDYYLIKSPRAEFPAMTRADFIAMMVKELALPIYKDGTVALGSAEEGLSDAMGTKVDLSGEIRPRGNDNVCIYMGGEIKVASAIATYPIAVGGCGTIVGGKMLFVYSYDDPAKANSVAVQLRRARALADTLAAADGRAN